MVMVSGSMEADSATASFGTALGYAGWLPLAASGERVSKDAHALGEELVKHIAGPLKSAGVAVYDTPVLLHAYPPNLADPPGLPPQDGKTPLLVIRPVSAKMECPRSCFAFRVLVRLLSPDRATELWRAVLDLPPKASNFSDFSVPAANFSEALAALMKKDGVIRP